MSKQVYVICHNIRSAYNVGSIFRTADGAGIDKIFLTGYSPTPENYKVLKTSLGAEQKVKWQKSRQISKIIQELKKQKFQIIALETGGQLLYDKKFKFKNKSVLILGNEKTGLSKTILNQVDKIISIPMRGFKESLNVSVAFGIAIYEITQQK
ncbi:MAG: TrmH family RNA methyltransferase [Patescibacteria group bacterium]|jgi:tRNA G18 (ribose-2'-O)-methylase SpoU|nr:TrmH family RNA methyltransferase [Patescibacteria group bacterium]